MIAGHKVFAFKRPSDLGIIGDWGLGIFRGLKGGWSKAFSSKWRAINQLFVGILFGLLCFAFSVFVGVFRLSEVFD